MPLPRLLRITFAALAFAGFPIVAGAHLIVDMSVKVLAPAFAATSSTIAYRLDVVDLAYDVGIGVVVTNTLPASAGFVSVSASGWNCTTSGATTTCSAETLTPGHSAITIMATAPSQGGTIRDT